MKLATIKSNDIESAAILHNNKLYDIDSLNKVIEYDYPTKLLDLITTGELTQLLNWYNSEGKNQLENAGIDSINEEDALYAPLYRHPRKIWGIGLNYQAHASDLDESSPTEEPASFMKPDTAIIGCGDTIELPLISDKTTGEAELGLIFGKECRHVELEDWKSVLAGFTSIIDMTAEDILRRNPRNLTQCKSFDTFFSFGPIFYTSDEIDDILAVKVSTIINGQLHAENHVANMTFPPDYLVSYHSQIMTMLPGDIISTGTPGAVPLMDGDLIECHIEGFKPLKNKVKDLKS